MDATFLRLARRQLSQALDTYESASHTARPNNGWIAALREAFDMTLRQLAARLELTPSSVSRLEQRERDDTITLGALRRAADALDCDLIYAVVPRRPLGGACGANILDAVIEARARQLAELQVGRVAHTMHLEDQRVSEVEYQIQIDERAAALAERPRQLWEPEDSSAGPSGSGSRPTPEK